VPGKMGIAASPDRDDTDFYTHRTLKNPE